jgi:MoaD family protein
MAVKVIIPTPLQKLTKNQADVEANGSNIRELIDDLEKNFPGLKERICDETGKIRRFINIYVNEEDVRFLKQDETLLKDGDEVSIIPAIAGGQGVGNRPERSRRTIGGE